MFEDDNFDTEFLGAAQRNRNIKEVEATRKEIAGLRADIKRRENEERAAPKCPYCAGPIADGVVKCRHCASDIKWCEVNGRSYPLKAEVNVEQFVAREKEKQREKRRDAEASARKEDERQMAQWKIQQVQRKNDAASARKKEKVSNIGCKISLGVGLAFGLWSLEKFPDDPTVPMFIIFSFFGFMFGVAVTCVVAWATE